MRHPAQHLDCGLGKWGMGKEGSHVVFWMVQGQITERSESQDCRFENVAHKQDDKGKEEAELWERQYMELL